MLKLITSRGLTVGNCYRKIMSGLEQVLEPITHQIQNWRRWSSWWRQAVGPAPAPAATARRTPASGPPARSRRP